MKKLTKYLSQIDLPELQPTVLKQLEAIQNFAMPLIKSTNNMALTLVSKLKTLQISGKEIGSMLDSGINMAKSALELNMQDYKTMLGDIINKINALLKNLEEVTAKQMLDKVTQSSQYAKEEGMKVAKRIYGERKAILMEHIQKATVAFEKLKVLYGKFNKKSVNKMLETSLKETTDLILKSAEQLSSFMKQLAELKLDEPVLKALEQANGHLKKYEVNGKITDLIDQLKTFNISKTVLDVIMKLEKYATGLYESSFVKAMVLYGRAESVLNYIKSVPKKSYDEWFSELKEFTLRNKEEVVNYLTNVYGLSEPKVKELYTSILTKAKSYMYIVDAAKDAYKSNYIAAAKEMYKSKLNLAKNAYQTKVDAARELYNIKYVAAQELYKTNYDDAYSKYVLANKVYKVILKKAERVYDDIKEPTIVVKDHYTSISVAFFNKQYEQAYTKVLTTYTKLYETMLNSIMEYKDLAFNKVEAEYMKFLVKHGDKTWEEIGEIIYKLADQQYLVAKTFTLAEYEKLLVLIEKIKVQGAKYYSEAQDEYTKALKQVQDKYAELEPQVKELYKKYIELAKVKIQLVKTTVDTYLSTATTEFKKSGRESPRFVRSQQIENSSTSV
jgi:hypothetical protein